MMRFGGCAALLLLLPAPPLLGQSGRGSITGIVSGPSRAPVPGARIEAAQLETGVVHATRSNATGHYLLPQLPIGAYEVRVEARGFRRVVRKDVALNVAEAISLPIQLEPGPADPPLVVATPLSQLETASSELGVTFGRPRVSLLPLAISGAIRNPEGFIFQSPGFTGTTAVTYINGSQGRAKEILVDGVSVTSSENGGTWSRYPSVEAVAEVRLLRGNYPAEYGRTGGGVEIFATRSGGNLFHGALFEYLRNQVLDARGFFSTDRPGNHQHEFGAVLSGPLAAPRLYHGRNRTFFHFVYSGFRLSQESASQLVSLPPAQFRQGDFSQLAGRNGAMTPIYDPATTAALPSGFTRQPFAGNQIPRSRFSRVSSAILPLLPTLSNDSLLNNFLTLGGTRTDQDQYHLKLNHFHSASHRVGAFLVWTQETARAPLRLPEPFTNARITHNRPRTARLTYDWTVSSTALNQLFAGATRFHETGESLAANQGWPDRIGLTGVNRGPGNAFPVVTFSDGYEPWGASTAGRSVGGQTDNTVQLADSLSLLRGRHAYKLGVDARWMQTGGAEWLWNQGRFSFSSFTTALPTVQGRTSTGNSFASFLLGEADSAMRRIQEIYPSHRYRYFATYFQDDWKASARLTLNYGLRHEIHFPRYSLHDNLGGFVPDLPNPAAGGLPGAIGFLGSGAGRIGRRSFADTDYKSFGPRFGFAWMLTPRTALRGGYGIFYAPGNAATGLRLATGFSYGLAVQPTYASADLGVTPALNWDRGFPAAEDLPPMFVPEVANGSSVNMIGRGDGRVPYVQNWSFSFQHTVPWDVLLDLTYAGNKGTRLGTNLISINELSPEWLRLGSLLSRPIDSPEAAAAGIPSPYPGFQGSVAQALRPYPQYLSIDNDSNPNGNSTYHAFQLWVRKQLSHGLTFTLAYTFSKTLSDGDVQAGGGPLGQSYYNRALEKAISTADVPQALALNFIYDIPFPARAPRLLARGWTLAGTQRYFAGTPVTLTATNTLPLFNGALRPDAEPEVARRRQFEDPATDRYINPAAFSVPPSLRLGTSARSYTDLRTPPFLNESYALVKRTPLTGRVSLVFRVHFFSALNRTVFGAPQANISNQDFGRIRSQANTPRQGHLALRLEF